MNARTAAYQARLQARLERAQVDADYAALRARAGMPYDHDPMMLRGGLCVHGVPSWRQCPSCESPRAVFERMEPYRELAERMARAEWGEPGPHGGQGKGIRGENVCRRCGEPYDGVSAHGPGHCARVDMTIPDALLAADVGLRVVRPPDAGENAARAAAAIADQHDLQRGWK